MPFYVALESPRKKRQTAPLKCLLAKLVVQSAVHKINKHRNIEKLWRTSIDLINISIKKKDKRKSFSKAPRKSVDNERPDKRALKLAR